MGKNSYQYALKITKYASICTYIFTETIQLHFCFNCILPSPVIPMTENKYTVRCKYKIQKKILFFDLNKNTNNGHYMFIIKTSNQKY